LIGLGCIDALKANFDCADLHSIAIYDSGNAANFFCDRDALKCSAYDCHNLQQPYHFSVLTGCNAWNLQGVRKSVVSWIWFGLWKADTWRQAQSQNSSFEAPPNSLGMSAGKSLGT
jgi:hypothetical protein